MKLLNNCLLISVALFLTPFDSSEGASPSVSAQGAISATATVDFPLGLISTSNARINLSDSFIRSSTQSNSDYLLYAPQLGSVLMRIEATGAVIHPLAEEYLPFGFCSRDEITELPAIFTKDRQRECSALGRLNSDTVLVTLIYTEN